MQLLDAVDAEIGSIHTNGAVRRGSGAMEDLSATPLNSNSILKLDRNAFVLPSTDVASKVWHHIL